jgi:hypothetical protein
MSARVTAFSVVHCVDEEGSESFGFHPVYGTPGYEKYKAGEKFPACDDGSGGTVEVLHLVSDGPLFDLLAQVEEDRNDDEVQEFLYTELPKSLVPMFKAVAKFVVERKGEVKQ